MNNDLRESFIKEFSYPAEFHPTQDGISRRLNSQSDWWLEKISQRDQALRERLLGMKKVKNPNKLIPVDVYMHINGYNEGIDDCISLLEPANTSGE
jgi:hypothetical protein